MQRTDLRIEGGRIIVHPLRLKALKKEARARINDDGREALREAIIDEQLDLYIGRDCGRRDCREDANRDQSHAPKGAKVMLGFKDYIRASTPDLPRLPKLQKLAKLLKMNRPVNRDEPRKNSGPTIQRMGSAEAVIHLRRIIAQLSMLIRRLSQE